MLPIRLRTLEGFLSGDGDLSGYRLYREELREFVGELAGFEPDDVYLGLVSDHARTLIEDYLRLLWGLSRRKGRADVTPPKVVPLR